MLWSSPAPYDLTRCLARASVPYAQTSNVPTLPGVYVIIRLDENLIQNRIIDIGKAGLRDGRGQQKPMGLRGRIASSVTHSASGRIATDLQNGGLTHMLHIIWWTVDSQLGAEELEAGLINLFEKEFGRKPVYNRRNAKCANPKNFEKNYEVLKQHLNQLH